MDYRKKVTFASALLGVLCLTAVLGVVFSQQAVAQREAQAPLLTGFQASDITGLTFGEVVLTKAPNWTLTYQGKAYPAAGDRIDTYVKSLQELLRERLVTRGSDVKAFGLDQGFKTVKILGAGGKVVADLQVGGTNDLGDKVYVRFAGQKEVWQTDRGFARSLDLDFNTWADLSLFPGRKADSLIRITFDSRIEAADKTVYAPFDLVKSTKAGKPAWENSATKTSADSIGTWAEQVASFRFGAFASPSDAPASAATLGTVTLSWSDGTRTTVKIGAPDTKNRYRCTDGTRDFWINDWGLGQILYK